MAPLLRYDDRVAVVTGAGAGLGRQYALLLASRGAKVVVNDLGGSRSGEGANSSAADQVVAEIRKAGGTAVPDYNSVVDGAKIIKTALENFGRIDILINNAGILRDKSFPRMSTAEWDIIFDVHVKGAYMTTHAAWEHFRKQKYGRIIFTSSNAGLYGNFGQANYSAAKMALVGFCNTISLEGKKYNIHSNVIVPTAASRLTEDILPPELFVELKPELIAPVVAWLCHEDCEETGNIIESAAGWAGKQALVRGKGALLRQKISDIVAPENVREKWSEVLDMSKAEPMDSIQEVTVALMNCLEQLKENTSYSSPSEATGMNIYEASPRDAIIYALGIGASVENSTDLKYLYENHEDFQAFPTQNIIPGQMAVMTSPTITSAIPGKTYDLTQVLHGEQYLEVYKPMPLDTKLRSEVQIVDVLDKGKNALIICGIRTFDENDELICYNEMTTFIRGAGGFGGSSTSSKGVPVGKIPNRVPDAICSEQTSPSQAALYRLAGDTNPLHIDPSFAQVAGFDKPILHGLATLGFTARHVLMRYGGNDPSLFKALKVRFVKPFLPGDIVRTFMWRDGNRIYFQTKTPQNTIVIDGAYMDLHKVVDDVSFNHGSIKLDFIDPKLFYDSHLSVVKDNASRYSEERLIAKNNPVATSETLMLKCADYSWRGSSGNHVNSLPNPNVILQTFYGSKL